MQKITNNIKFILCFLSISVILNNEFKLMGSIKFIEDLSRLPTSINCCANKFGIADLNKDGFADIYVATSTFNPPQTAQNRILINDGHGFFSDQTQERLPEIKTASITSLIGDFDNDGDLDIFDGTFKDFDPYDGYQDRFYVNNGQGYFSDKTTLALPNAITNTDASAFADIDNDGDLDIFRSNRHGYSTILINNGSGIFHEERNRLPDNGEKLYNGGISSAIFIDSDNNKSMDLFLTSFWGDWEDGVNGKWPHMLLLNNGKGFFELATSYSMPEKIRDSIPYISRAADFNKDGRIDIIIGNSGDVGKFNQLLINMGNNQFLDRTSFISQMKDINRTVSLDLGDFDNDGDVDFVTVNCCGFTSEKENGIALYENQGNGYFVDVTSEVIPFLYGEDCIDAKFIDIENDGDLDLIVMSAYTGARIFVNNCIAHGPF